MRPRPSPDALSCEVCGKVCMTHVALRAHYNKSHAVLDDQLVTTRSFHCLRCTGIFFSSSSSLKGHACINADKLLSSRVVGSVQDTVSRPPPSRWVIATDGSATLATEFSLATAGWGFVVNRIGVLEGLECECWGEVLLDERDPRALGADSLSNNAGELWAIAEALLWLKHESNDSGRVPVTFVYDSEVAKGLITEPWAPHSHLKLVALLRDLFWGMIDTRLITWIHVRSHGRENDPEKQHSLPLGRISWQNGAVLAFHVSL